MSGHETRAVIEEAIRQVDLSENVHFVGIPKKYADVLQRCAEALLKEHKPMEREGVLGCSCPRAWSCHVLEQAAKGLSE